MALQIVINTGEGPLRPVEREVLRLLLDEPAPGATSSAGRVVVK